ncbi:hypothetical protein FMM05_10635 [Flavobacterium zepuense]|uniref:Lipocalin-like domain-containing protein n=1 Tax=Flavobacterium zepuense TaxID=2593302 RepID=A0A552V1D0_9FLAO|nr:hypothetical protein [Flavobacterium zepuense]TRW24281.1 hypothetical protein FMM05_10635 [Flavobacterium zepuense]
MKIKVYALLLIALTACNNKETIDKETTTDVKDTTSAKFYKVDKKAESNLHEQLIGAWTTEGYQNAVFSIKNDSVYYVENDETFPYKLIGNVLTIEYTDDSMNFDVSFTGDTLVLKSAREGDSKYWRFTE